MDDNRTFAHRWLFLPCAFGFNPVTPRPLEAKYRLWGLPTTISDSQARPNNWLEGNMRTRWTAMIGGAAVVLLAASYGANADPADGDGVRHDHYWDHPRDGGRHHDHYWDHASGGIAQNAIGSSEGAGRSAPAGAPARLLAAGIPAFALIGGSLGVRGLMRAFRRRNKI